MFDTLKILVLVMPDNPAAAALVLFGLILFFLEFHAPTFGLLGVGGAVLFTAGLFMLVDAVGFEAAGVSPGTLYGIGAAGAAMALGAGWLGWRASKRKVTTGPEAMIGAEALVREWSGDSGRVHIQGEEWSAVSERPQALSPGDRVRILAVEDLTLRISLPPQ